MDVVHTAVLENVKMPAQGRTSLVSALALLAVIACATAPQDRQELESVYLKHAGEPINNIYIGIGIRDWQVIDADTIRVELTRKRHVLVDFAPPCSSVLRSVERFALIASHSGYLSNFDRVQMGDVSCRIQTLRVLNYPAVQAELNSTGDKAVG